MLLALEVPLSLTHWRQAELVILDVDEDVAGLARHFTVFDFEKAGALLDVVILSMAYLWTLIILALQKVIT